MQEPVRFVELSFVTSQDADDKLGDVSDSGDATVPNDNFSLSDALI